MDTSEFNLRLIIMSIVLKVRSRCRDERAFEQAFLARIQSLLGR
jgi:hypothetical protein